ncbi:leucyl aminopeptidase family protein [Sphingomonas sp.]|uniref:leucyl aminopeptidase family protein n=1 Tax=Sphingomonas sp. TaxID=28214 RepID=UPI00286A945A|nr:leucyl aminopeptidase family protein [Sphingomonas sp.]
MTDFTTLLQPDRGEPARLIHVVDKDNFSVWAKKQSPARQSMLEAIQFDAKSAFQFAILQGKKDGEFDVVTCVDQAGDLGPWCMARLGQSLPAGKYRIDDGEPGLAALGWMLSQHRFDRYKSDPPQPIGARVLLTGDVADIDPMIRLAEATAMVRDMVDTPASDMGPANLEGVVRYLAKAANATIEVTHGDALNTGFPMIAAVGNGASRDRAPRLIELRWGKENAPRIAIIGKGVCFDSGGLDIKPSSGMRLMKKDMGGAAHAIALAKLIIGARLPVRLHLLIPAVENSISATAFRPGDIIASRKGLNVEIDNTDAEGRLVLGDALTKAVESDPELMIDFATLTGAARIALGPDLPAMFANDEDLAADLIAASGAAHDPLWRMPLWDEYDDMLKSDLADLANSADSPMAGSITAALFLRRFVSAETPWAHFDTFAWQPSAKPGRPKGGAALGLRAVFEMLHRRFRPA